MLGIIRYWPMLALVAAGAGLRLGGMPPVQDGRRPGQAQTAGRFLRAVLRADYPAAYARLAPEVRQEFSFSQFIAAARPLWKSGQRHGPGIELYKLGVRLGERGASRLFYTFSYATDSLSKKPSELLEVTFRDTATRAVLSFGLRSSAKPASRRPLPQSNRK